MEINILRPDNEIVLVDKNRFDELYSSAEMNEKQIEERAEEMFLNHIKKSGINLRFEINNEPNSLMKYGVVVNELNYDERGYPESVSDKLKQAVADDITNYINAKFVNIKKDTQAYAKWLFDSKERFYEKKLTLWKFISGCSAVIIILETLLLCLI